MYRPTNDTKANEPQFKSPKDYVKARGQNYMVYIEGQDNAGDGTVPGHSGQAPGTHSKFCAKMKGYGHQDSYSDPKVQALTLYSILKIAQTAKVLA